MQKRSFIPPSPPSTRTNPRTSNGALYAIQLCTLLAAAMAPLAAGAFTRTYVSECHLSDGSKFVLRANYDYNPLAGHAAKGPVEDWGIFYKPKGKFRETRAPQTLPFHGPDNPDCTKLGLINGTPVVYFSFLDKNGKWFSPDRIPDNVQQATSDNEPGVKQLLETHQLGSLYRVAFVAPVGADIVYETPLLTLRHRTPDGTIVAVMQSMSRDGGKTWSAPEITTKARIYELGKSHLAQSFVGKPGKREGPDR